MRPSELMHNWQELDVLSEDKIKKRMIGVYNKLYLFLQLLRMFT